MTITYNDKTDLLYIRFDDKKQDVINKRQPAKNMFWLFVEVSW